MPNFLHAPIGAGDVLGRFKFDRPRGEAEVPFTEEYAMQLAELVNRAVELERSAVWINPETDSRGVRIHGTPVELGGRALKFTSQYELGVFPVPSAA